MSPQQSPPPPSPEQDPLFLPAISEVVTDPAKVEVPKHQLDVPVAMANLKVAISQLGSANEAAGLIFTAEQPEESLVRQDLVNGVGGEANLDVYYGFLKGNNKSADVHRKEWAEAAYANAIRFWTGIDVPRNDLTLQVGFARFRRLYGATGKDAQRIRRGAVARLQRGIKTSGHEIPIGVFYNPNVTVYASSLVEAGQLPWKEISRKIGLSAAEANPEDFPYLSHLLDTTPTEDDVILSEADQKINESLSMDKLGAVYTAAKQSKQKKLLAESGTTIPTAEQRQEAEAKGREIADARYESQKKRLAARIQELKRQAMVLDQFNTAMSSQQDTAFEINGRGIATIHSAVIPEYASIVSGTMGLTEDEKPLFEQGLQQELEMAVFSPDGEFASSITKRMMWMIEDRIDLLQKVEKAAHPFVREYGRATLNAAKIKP